MAPQQIWWRTINHCLLLGFTQESFRILEAKVSEETQRGRAVRVSLIFDEVSIRKQIDWTGHNFIGCVDLGNYLLLLDFKAKRFV